MCINKIIFFSIILLLNALLSCDSPTDVQANRVLIENKPSGKDVFEILPKSFSLNHLLFDKEYEAIFLIKNLTNSELKFSNLRFKYQPQNFRFRSNEKLVLAPKGMEGSEKFVSVLIRPKLLGILKDTLFFDSYSDPIVSYSGMVPTIFTSDVDFGNALPGETKYKTINIYNFGESTAILNGVNIIGDSSVFKISNFNPTTNPIYIFPGGVARQLIISFSPEKDISYEVRYEFQFETSNSGYIDNISTATGLGQ